MLGRGIVRSDDRDQFDLFKLMLADHAAGVLARRAGLRAEARGPGGVAQRQRALVEDFAGNEVGQRHLGGRDQPIPIGGSEHILGEFRELADPKRRFIADQQRRRNLGVAEFGRMEIEHELAERPLEPSQRAAQNDKSRPGQLPGARKIHHAEPLADRLVRQRCEVETRRLAMMAHHPIGGLVRPVRHLFGRKVRETSEDLVDLRAQSRRLRSPACGFDLPVLAGLAQQRRYVIAALLGGADLPGDAVALGLRFLGTSLGGAPRPVERQDLLGARRQTAPR